MIDIGLNLKKDDNDIGTFPLDSFPSYLVEYINKIHSSTGKNRLMTVGAVMSAFASANGTFYQIQAGDSWREKTIFWIIISATSGMGKTPAMYPILKPLYDFNQELERNHEEQVKVDPNTNKTRQRLIITDATIEAVVKSHGENESGLLIHQDELDAWFSSMGAYKKGGSSADAAQYNSMFNGRAVEKIRVKSDSISIKETCVNILGGVQPELIKEHLSKYSDNGFVFRFLPFMIDEEYTSINLFHPKINSSEYELAINTLLCNRNTGIDPKVIHFEHEALIKLNEYLNYLEKEKNKFKGTIIPAVYSKMQYYLIRLCLLVELMYDQNPKIVTLKSYNHAKKIFEWFLDQSISFVMTSKNGSSKSASKIEQFLKSKLEPGVTYKKQDIIEMLSATFSTLSERTLGDLIQNASFLKKEGHGKYSIIQSYE